MGWDTAGKGRAQLPGFCPFPGNEEGTVVYTIVVPPLRYVPPSPRKA